ncbi:MAG: ketopantoate reductase C-terminal domain-containing protein, partial [Verrucomicrobiota bacterium]
RPARGPAWAGAQALGYPIPVEFAEQQIEVTRPMGRYKPSTLLDVRAGREIEVEAIWGEALRRAEGAGCAMPRVRGIYRQLKAFGGE